MKRAFCVVVALFFLGTAVWAASVFTQKRQLDQVNDVAALESGMLNASKRICALAQLGQSIKTQWVADVAAGDLDQESVDELNVKIAEVADLVQAATAYRDAHQ